MFLILSLVKVQAAIKMIDRIMSSLIYSSIVTDLFMIKYYEVSKENTFVDQKINK